MRIAVSGAQGTGKSTFVKNFQYAWPMYTTPIDLYRQQIEKLKDDDEINQGMTQHGQGLLRNALSEMALNNAKERYIIHDRCILDNLAYTLVGAGREEAKEEDEERKEPKTFDEEFMAASFLITRECLQFFDIIFLLPISDRTPIEVETLEEDGDDTRDTDPEFRTEVDNVFASFHESEYMARSGLVFPIQNSPAFIKLEGSEEEMIAQAAQYLSPDGDITNADVEEMQKTLVKDMKTMEEEMEMDEIKKALGEPQVEEDDLPPNFKI